MVVRHDLPQGTVEGLVVSSVGMEAEVEWGGAAPVRCRQPPGKEYAVVGDRVVVRDADPPRIVSILPRSRSLCRPSKRRIQIIAANVDRLLIVAAVEPPLRTRLIDRYLVAAESQGIEAVIVVNKVDLPGSDAAMQAVAVYRSLEYRVLATSARRADGLDELRGILSSGSNVLAGHSGVGKSSLLNALFPGREIKTGEISQASGRGRHVTSTAVAYRLGEGLVIDTPGIREFGLANVEARDLARCFREIARWAGLCRFSDCRHLAEPGCRVAEARRDGEVSEERYASYVQLFKELEE